MKARNWSTYRGSRRNMALRILKVDWSTFNSREYWDREPEFEANMFGNVPSSMCRNVSSRSKYMPHFGAKQRAKGLSS